MRRGVFPNGFPHHVQDSGPSHHFKAVPTAGGTSSAAAAQSRIEPAGGGGERTRFEGVNRGSTSTGTENLAQRLVTG